MNLGIVIQLCKWTKIFIQLSCSNVCHFNTALAFDREGQIICQYHKYNLYGSEQLYLNKPFYPKGVYFETDFGEKVGLLICFDINFAEPVKLHNVDAIAYPVAWTDELPFLTGKI